MGELQNLLNHSPLSWVRRAAGKHRAAAGGLHWGRPEVRGDITAPCKTCGNGRNWRMWEGWRGGLSALSSMFPRKPSTANITLVLPCGPAHVMSRTISHNSAQKVSKTWWNVPWFWPDFLSWNKKLRVFALSWSFVTKSQANLFFL